VILKKKPDSCEPLALKFVVHLLALIYFSYIVLKAAVPIISFSVETLTRAHYFDVTSLRCLFYFAVITLNCAAPMEGLLLKL
jgi:hypothetical protein